MSTTTGLRNMTFDDRDTTYLKYQGNWFTSGSWNASNVEESGTLSSTNDLNANVTFTFPTPAVGFYYYGIPRSRGGSYGICIDCDPNNRVFLSIDAVNTTDDGKNPPIVLFSMQFKTPGVHEIILKNQPDPRFNGNSQITLDKFDLEVIDPTVGSVLPPDTAVSPSQISTLTSTSITTDVAFSSSSPSPSTPTAAIVGGVLGGLAVLFFITSLLFWLRIRRLKAFRLESRFQEDNYSQSHLTQASAYTSMPPESISSFTEISFPTPGSAGFSDGLGRHPLSTTFSDTSSAAHTSSTGLSTLLELLAARTQSNA